MACGSPPIRIVTLMSKQTLSTNGSMTWTSRVFSPKGLYNIGPYLAKVTVHADCEERTTNFEYKVTGAYSYDGETWTPFGSDVLAPQSANGAVIGSAYTTTTNFGLFVRFAVTARNSSGTAIESGVVSVTLVLELIR